MRRRRCRCGANELARPLPQTPFPAFLSPHTHTGVEGGEQAFGKKGHSEPEAEKPAYEALKSTEEGTASSLALSELKGQATTTTSTK